MKITRSVEAHLKDWTDDRFRKVLLLRGPRQVGKTFTVREHARAHYKHFLEVNFVSDKRARGFFGENIDINSIIESLAVLYDVTIVGGETLVFFDEIQECPAALEALRFFYELRPDIHLIASGSLLEFALEQIPSNGVYVLQIGNQIVPIEIKSATKGSMQSMHRFLSEKTENQSACFGVRLSMKNFFDFENILVVPLYAISQLERIVMEHKTKYWMH